MNSLVSIVVPIYNAEKYLSRCIESILNQTYDNLQVILVNDGSTDNSLEICMFYKNKDKRITVVNKNNEGVAKARNLGIEMSEGNYIGFVDSDDYINYNMYERLLKKTITDRSQACAMVNHTINKLDIEKDKKELTREEVLRKLLLLKFPTSLWSYLYSKEIIEDTRLNEEIHFFEDLDFNFKVFSRLNKISLCYEELYHYETNEGSINAQAINDKKITCLKIFDQPENKSIIEKYELCEYSSYSKAHFLVSLILIMSKLKNRDKNYYNIVKNYARSILKETLESRQIGRTFKSVVLLSSIDPLALCKVIYIMKYRMN